MNFFKGPALRIIISLSSLGVIIYLLRDKLGDAIHILTHDVSWNWFLISLVGYIFVQLIMAYRLYRIFSIQGLRIRYKETLYLCTVGLFFNLFLPSAVGGDIAKIYYASKHSGRKIEATTAVFVDRLMGFIAIMLIALAALIFFGDQLTEKWIVKVVYGFIALMVITVGMFASRRLSKPIRSLRFLLPTQKIRDKMAELYHAIYSCKKSWPTLIFCIVLSVAGQSLIVYMYYWLTLGLGALVEPAVFFLGVPLITIVSMVPSIGGLGVREAGAYFFFSQYMTGERATALFILVFIVIYGFGLAAGLVYALGGGLKKASLKEMERA